MKIYLFNPVNGAYLGEAFADESPLKRGECSIPDDATLIPPPQVESGQMTFFNIREQCWEVRSIESLRKNLSGDKLDENTSSEESQ